MDADVWEACKENAMPLKRGRDPKKMCGFGGNKEIMSRKERLQREQEAFEQDLLSATSNSNMTDPLAVWVKYIKWMQETHPSGNTELLELFERCTRQFKDDERYKNNETYLKIWIGYADLLDNPTAVFKYLRENKIGEKLALYYIATAWTAERRGDFPLADKAYSVGLEKKSEPVELLKKRHREFQRRMSRRWLDQAERERRGEEIVDNVTAEQEEKWQRSLQIISEESAASSHRPSGAERIHPNITGRRSGGGGLQQRTQQENTEPAQLFQVYSEEDTETWKKEDWGNDENTLPSQRRCLPKQKESQKENNLEPGPWVRQGFGPPSNPVAAQRTEKLFDVFVDDDCSDENGSQKDEDAQVNEDKKLKLQERSRREKTESEILHKKPLQHFQSNDGPPTVRRVATAESDQDGEQILLEDEDVTINTKLALDDMFEMFGSPSMKKEKVTKPFSIFSAERAQKKPEETLSEQEQDLTAVSFAPLEAILEASAEIDESVNTSGNRSALGSRDSSNKSESSSSRRKFSIFQD